MTIFLPSLRLSIPHARRIDKLVCAMHADRLRLLALEADAGFPPRSVSPVRVVIRAQRRSLWERCCALVGAL